MKDFLYMKHCPKCNIYSVTSNNICLECGYELEGYELEEPKSNNGFIIFFIFILILIIGMFELGVYKPFIEF